MRNHTQVFPFGTREKSFHLFFLIVLLASVPVFGWVKADPPLSPYSVTGFAQKGVDFSANDTRGKRHSFSIHKDKGLFLYFFTPTLTSCLIDLEKTNDVYKDNMAGKEKFEFIAFCVGCDKEETENIVKKGLIAFPVIPDTNKKIAKSYGVKVLPVSLVVSSWRTVKFEHLGRIGEMDPLFFKSFDEFLGIRLGIKRFRHSNKEEKEAFVKTLSKRQRLSVFDMKDPKIISVAQKIPCICNPKLNLIDCNCDREYRFAMYQWINFFIMDGAIDLEKITKILIWKYEGELKEKAEREKENE